MSTGLHRDLADIEIHRPYRKTFADAAARTGDTGPYVATEQYCKALQLDTGAEYYLSAVSPVTWTPVSMAAGSARSVIIWGDDGISTTTTARYLTPGYDDSIAETSVAEFRIPVAGTLKNLRVRHNTAGVGAATITYTVQKNGSDQSLAVAMSNTAQDGSDLSNTVAVAAGDLVSIKVTKSASISTSPDNIVAALELDA